MVPVQRSDVFKGAGLIFSLLLLAACVIALGPWSAQHASAQTITATCADKSTDSATLNAAPATRAIRSSSPGSAC